MSEKKSNDEFSDKMNGIIESIEKDVKDHKELLEHINQNANKILDMLEIQDENILEIKEAQEHWRQIADNTRMIASAISNYGEQNLKLIDVAIGRKQVPTSVFILVVTFVGVITLGMLVFLTGVNLKVNDIEISKGSQYGIAED
jgi:polyribonucleotide nucleotidyltransferase